MRQIEMPPNALALMESTRAIGYSLRTAIADIIDNSVAADAYNVHISFFPLEDAYISILDDGIGMDGNELNYAMQYGGNGPRIKRSDKDLGRFGLGMKTASLSQCDILTVISKKENKIEARRWDLGFVAKQDKWALEKLNKSEIDKLPEVENLKAQKSGTLILWQKLDRLQQGDDMQHSMGMKMDEVRSHLSLVFHRYLQGEAGLHKVNITMNDSVIEPIDPFLSHRNTQAIDDEIININNSKIVVRPYILPHPSKMTSEEYKMLGGDKETLRKGQGFYIYRNKRLIVWGTWFGMTRKSDLSKLARVQVDIPNTFDRLWVLDVKKSNATPPLAIRKNLSKIIDNMIEKSKRTWTYRGKKEVDDKVNHIWNRLRTRDGGYVYEINKKHPLVQQITEENPGCGNQLNSLLVLIANMIPLNQIIVDCNEDVNVINDSLVTKEKVREMLNGLLSITPEGKKKALLEKLRYTEPFNAYIELLNEYNL